MKHVKFLLINIIAFSILFFFISLLFPGQVVTSKSVSIAGSKETIVTKLKTTNEWSKWNVFIQGGEVKNNSVGNTDTLAFSFENKHHETFHSQFVVYSDAGSAMLLNWNFTEKLPWYKPWKKFSAMVLSKEVAAIMDSSLNNFKTQVETGK